MFFSTVELLPERKETPLNLAAVTVKAAVSHRGQDIINPCSRTSPAGIDVFLEVATLRPGARETSQKSFV
ncbi:hypothetical protein Q7C36_008449 [Tachysurus vachellii]|uniref:Uncharacterized protein n=1 Tax=Tachysurus vachellii TaxID=175792 RepID=A0AA88N998_TACVA|nr:hypothetical protein Q7C36_008449 [Tachysurus vachellii]